MAVILEPTGQNAGITFVVRSARLNPIRLISAIKGESITVDIDYSPWAEDNGSVSAVVAAVKSGDVSIGNEVLASNVKTIIITASSVGQNMVTLTATAGNNVHLLHIRIMVRDPGVVTSDYGFFS